MESADIKGIADQHDLHLDQRYKGNEVNMHEMYAMENIHMLHLC